MTLCNVNIRSQHGMSLFNDAWEHVEMLPVGFVLENSAVKIKYAFLITDLPQN